jgi:hypothetical protein
MLLCQQYTGFHARDYQNELIAKRGAPPFQVESQQLGDSSRSARKPLANGKTIDLLLSTFAAYLHAC